MGFSVSTWSINMAWEGSAVKEALSCLVSSRESCPMTRESKWGEETVAKKKVQTLVLE